MEMNSFLRGFLHTMKRKGMEKLSQEEIDCKKTKTIVSDIV